MVPSKLAILCDYAEERWPSMDLVAQMLAEQLRQNHAQEFDVTMLQPPSDLQKGSCDVTR